MKILISRKDIKDTTSGVPKKVLQELLFFKRLGHTPYAIAETINSEMINEFGGIPVKTFRWPFSGLTRRKVYQKLVERWIARNRPDIVIGHGDIEKQDVLFIHNCVHLTHELIEGKPLPQDHEVGVIHEGILKKGQFKLLVCNSQMMKEDLVKRFAVDPSKAEVIYPEVNLAKFKVDDPKSVKLEWRKKFQLSEEHIVIGLITSGNFKKRNLKTLIEAFARVSAAKPLTQLFVAGGNIDQAFKDQVSKLRLQDKVIFAPAILDVKNYYYLIDIFVLPAFIEEFGRSVLEAMFCGRPVIATKTVGATEILEGKSREFIMDHPSEEVIVHMLQRLISDEKLSQELGALNQSTAQKYSADVQNDVFGETLKKFGIL